jgi:glutamyl-tRNA synthetase
VRTALYNYLFAKNQGGEIYLRIEDTDQSRYVAGAEEYIEESLSWLGIEFDQSPSKGGPHAPYRQSERKAIYAEYAQKLIDTGKAYYAFDTAEDLAEMRAKLEAAKADNPSYNSVTRMQMKNSITLSNDEVAAKLAAGEPYVIRLKVPIKEEIRFKDLIRDWVVVHSSTIDDKVLLKADGMPTYHLANIVDDHLMEITHVIRGEEWLPSAPLHILLYRAFGWEAPQFAHLPLLLKPQGNGKLSKRDGLLGDFPVFPMEWKDGGGEISRGFKEDGYFPEALVNFLALLGWNPGTEQEMFNMDELIAAFSFDKINRSGARFDVDKAKWFNQQYLKNKTDKELADLLNKKVNNPEMAANLVTLMKDRVTFVDEMVDETPFLFSAPLSYDKTIAEKKWDDTVKSTFPKIISLFETMDAEAFKTAAIHKVLFEDLAEQEGIKPGKIMQAFRLAVTGLGQGPDLMLTLEILGKNEVIARIQKALDTLGK